MTQFKVKVCEPESWLVEKLCPGKEVPWAAMKMGISLHDFIVESQIWFSIIYSRISPFTNMTYVPEVRAWMIVYILDNIYLNVGHLIL